MLKIRLQRTGKRGQAYFRVVVLEHTKKPKGKFLELLGNYDPHKKELNVKMDRVEYWISKGAQASPTTNNLLVNYKYWDKPKVQSWKPKKKPTTNNQPIRRIQQVHRGESIEPQAQGPEFIEGQPTTQKETSIETSTEQKSAEEPKKEETQAESQLDSAESSGEAKPEA